MEKIILSIILASSASSSLLVAENENRQEATNQVTGCRLQDKNRLKAIGYRLEEEKNQRTDNRKTELILEDQIGQRVKITTNYQLPTANCDNLGFDLSCHLMMDPAELKNIENGTQAIGEALGIVEKEVDTTETAVVTGAGRSAIERSIASSNSSHQVLRLRGGGPK